MAGALKVTRAAVDATAQTGSAKVTRVGIDVAATSGNAMVMRVAMDIVTSALLPIAEAGNSVTVSSGSLVTLDSSGSQTSAGTITTRTWRLSSKGDAGSPNVTLSSTTAIAPTLRMPILPYPTTYTFGLVVTNSVGGTSAEDFVTVAVSAADEYVATSSGWKPVAVIIAGEPAWH